MKTINQNKIVNNMIIVTHYKTKWLIAVRKRGVVGKNPAFVVNHPKSFNHSSVFKQKLILIPLNGIYRGGDVAGLQSIVDKIIY